jgi:hypothetical protein
MICYSNDQFECLHATPYEKRFLHFDATGGFISLNKDQLIKMTEPYHRILTYFMLSKHFDYIEEKTVGKAIGKI